MVEIESWGRFEDAERWRAEAFAALSSAARFAWLEGCWLLHRAGVNRRESVHVDERSDGQGIGAPARKR
jgi:hypothetical protein